MRRSIFSKEIFVFVIPIILLIVLCYNVNESKQATLSTVDPEYIHLISSIKMANGHFYLQSIENPATSLYLFGAITVKLSFLITGKEKTLTDDFILDPEKYIFSLRYALILFTFFSLIIAGMLIYKYSGKLVAVFFLQLAPFVSTSLLLSASLICPENLLIPITIWYISLLFLLTGKFTTEVRLIVMFALVVSLGLATKLTFFPLFLPPLFLFSKNKYRFYYLALSFGLILLFAFPVVLQYDRFFNWVNGLIFHSGHYGSGDSNIIDVNIFWNNFRKIISTEVLFSITWIVLFLHLLYSFFSGHIRNRKYLFFLIIWIAVTLQIALSSKHFAIRYLTPSFILTNYVIYELGMFYKSAFKSYLNLVYAVILLLIMGSGMGKLYGYNNKYKTFRNSRMGAHNFIKENLEGKPLLIIPNYFGSSTEQYSLYFSANWTGRYRQQYFKRLNSKFPGTYFHFPQRRIYMLWDNTTTLFNILKAHNELYLCASLYDSSSMDELLAEMKNKLLFFNKFDVELVEMTEVYRSRDDVICRLQVDSSQLNSFYHYKEIKLDMENPSQQIPEVDTNLKFEILNYKNLDSTQSFSGRFSQSLCKNSPWGTGIIIQGVKQGKHIESAIWVKSNDENCRLAAKTENSGDLSLSGNYVVQKKNGWKQILLSFDVDEKIEKQPLRIFIYYVGENQAYADDFTVKVGSIISKLTNFSREEM
ncbi:MAG: hypothetical protein K9H49_05740 [Bacteroidales bacterium]|nr:hypothetical protein [Bacteroidales bacterium]MCF8404390.1 hypothetical protein [Bacteroidales bacterium]